MRNILLFLLMLLLLSGCGRSSPSAYYILEGGNLPATTVLPNKSLRVAQVNVPGYLNRNNIVSRVQGKTSLVLAEFHLWAEPLGAGVRRILEDNLVEPMLEAGVAVLPASTDTPGDYVLTVDVQRLDGNFNEMAVLECHWALYDRDERVVTRGVFTDQEQVSGEDYSALVGTESQLVRNLARYLAGQLAGAIK